MRKRAKGDIPKDVERYVEEHKEQGSDESKAWALAWSRYCQYSNPDSPHCHKDEYFEGRKASKGRKAGKLAVQDRNNLNRALDKAGFDGNKPFRSVSQGLSRLQEVMAEWGLEPDQIFSAHLFKTAQGTQQIWLAHSNPSDPFSPDPVRNSMIVFQWYTHQSGNLEIVAYAS